ncbi:MAG: hypothetical protein MUO77_11225 [Anaerolineales bacterium]|nr:hypothetical protein [Anaerolineales bacterium]
MSQKKKTARTPNKTSPKRLNTEVNNPQPVFSKVELRALAEAKLGNRKKAIPPLTELESQGIIQELQVHQIELEMQNEELMQIRAKAEAALHQYFELYDFAPSGYFTLKRDGAIQHVNLAGATMLGVERGNF